MKKLLRIFLVLVVLFVLLVGAGLFTLTRPGVQKKLIESRLPEGSSVRTVRVTTGSLEFSELKLALPDGTDVRVATLDTEFDALAALFDNTVKLGALNVGGLVVEIPQTLIQSPTPATPPSSLPDTPSRQTPTAVVQPASTDTPAQEAPGSPIDVLYAIGQFDWLIDIDSINLEGELRDGAGSTYSIDLRSGAIRPGEEATIEASLKLNAREPLHAGLTKFDASSRLILKQNIDGGFEQVSLESLSNASDQRGSNLLTVSQEIDLSVEGFDERASLNLLFNADLPKPEIFLPEMAGVGPVNVQGSLVAGVEGSELTLAETDILLSSSGTEMAAVELKKSFTLGGPKDLSGDLMDIRITNLPLALLAPWMPEGLVLSGSDLSARLNLTGLPDGVLQLSTLEPIRLGPVSLTQDGVPLLNRATILAQPVIRVAADNSITVDLNELTSNKTDLLLSSGGDELLAVDLKKALALGSLDNLSGDLMDVRITNLPLAMLSPWVPEEFAMSGNIDTAQFNLTGLPGGVIRMSAMAPMRLSPVSLSHNGVPLLNQVTILAQPVIDLAADLSITWDLGGFQMQDRYGAFLSGKSTGKFDQSTVTRGFLPVGLQTQTRLDFGLQEITQQPALAGYASILSGRATVDLNLDPKVQYPLQVQGQINGISPRAYPGQRQNYRFALQLNEPGSDVVAIGANIEAGIEGRPSSNLQFSGQLRPQASPLEFKLDLTGQRINQRDIQLLAAAFQQKEPANEPETGVIAPPSPSLPTSGGAPTPVLSAGAGPPWAGYDGELNIKIGEAYLLSGEVINNLVAKAAVSERRLSLDQLQGTVQDGKISGKGEARYAKDQPNAYSLQTDMVLENFDPAMFSSKGQGSFPVQGKFSGNANFAGQGRTLDQALDAIAGEFLLTGREGVLTAFKLDTRSNLGLIGAGLLGNQLNRPGLTAMAQAVPYFENMPFSDFSLRLNRKSDGRILIPELRFVGRNLLIDGTGSIAATSLDDAMNQPLDMTLELGAKGKLVDYLETLELLGPDTSEDGFRRWERTIDIKGSLSDPDTSALERILKDAANRALTQSPKDKEEAAQKAEGKESPAEENPKEKPSKEDKIIRDVGTGLDILNSLLGE